MRADRALVGEPIEEFAVLLDDLRNDLVLLRFAFLLVHV